MKHYTFVTKMRGLLDVLDTASYVIFTTVSDNGYVTGYAQGSTAPPGVTSICATASSKIMREMFKSTPSATEVGMYTTMGVCATCNATRSLTWTPTQCDTCLLLIAAS